jgi:putative ribosome biogenesis GTPase RsgA
MSASSSDVVIAVMGMTGVGKSSFIKAVSGRKDIVIGHKLSSGLSDDPTWK